MSTVTHYVASDIQPTALLKLILDCTFCYQELHRGSHDITVPVNCWKHVREGVESGLTVLLVSVELSAMMLGQFILYTTIVFCRKLNLNSCLK